jgi:hypothetical protein
LLGQTGERLQILYGVIKPQYIQGNDFREGKAGLGAAGAHSGFLAAVGFQNSIDKVINDAVCGNQHSLGHNADCSLWFGSCNHTGKWAFFLPCHLKLKIRPIKY